MFKTVTDIGKTRKIEGRDGELSYQVGNLQMIGARSAQEDSFALVNALDVNEIIQKGLFAIVADGMGGLKDGKLVSEAAISGFVQSFHNLDKTSDIPSQLINSVGQVNRILHDKFKGDGGTTVVSVLIYNSSVYWISVGDSSIYLYRNGGLYKMNQDHTYQNELYLEEAYKEDIDKSRVQSNKDGARLSEFLGNSSVDAIDYNRKPLYLRNGDTILLCSDGISSYLDETMIANALAHPPETACEFIRMALDAQAHKNQDNYTAIVISCTN